MTLPRLQLFEVNDLAWVPRPLHDTIVESLSRALDWGRMMRGLVGPFAELLDQSGADEVLELGSGAGGPARVLVAELRRQGRRVPRILLTDLHPQPEAWRRAREQSGGALDFVDAPVDATAIPAELARGRVRSIVNVFHHFPPSLARAVLADAVAHSRGVFLAEAFERQPLQFANFAPAGLAALAANPLLSERDRLAKAILTWATPMAIAASIWDGLVSTMRVYSEDELRAMVAPLDGGWVWRYGRYDYPPFGRGYYFTGVPPAAKSRAI
jgi:hypothetical protein